MAGRIAGVMAAVALLASAAGFSAPPAAAGLTSGDSIPEVRVLPWHVIVIPDDPGDLGLEVMTVPVTLQAGQTRLISDQLTVTVTRDDAEVENILECVDPTGDRNVGVNAGGQPEAYGSGTNYTRGGGQLVMHGSLLFTAPHTGTFWCQIRAHTDAGNDHGYHLTAVAAPRPGGTWIAIDNFTGDAPLWWQINTCQSNGRVPKTNRTDPNCVFLGRPLGSHGHPVTATLHGWPPSTLDTPDVHLSDVWVAPSDATTASVAGHMQITSCFPGTASCPGSEQGSSDIGPGGVVIVWDTAVFRTHLELVQLDPGGAPCAVASTPDTQYTITDAVHHFLVDYGPMTVAISPTCGGSRRFALHIVVTWVFGNAVKIDSGSVFGFRSATNANVIVRSTAPATTVPPLIGADQGTAASRLAGRGLTVGTVTSVVDPARAGTVIASNSPAWTSEPAGSPVDLTISRGAVTVPDLEGDTTAQAVRELAAAGLVASIEHTAQCTDPGHVIGQRPAAGAIVAPGSTVTITIDDGASGSIICR